MFSCPYEHIIHTHTFFSSFLTWRTRLPLNRTWFRTLNVTTHLSYSFWEFPSCCWTLSGSWDHGMFFWIYDSTWGFIFIILIKMQHVNAVVVTETVEILWFTCFEKFHLISAIKRRDVSLVGIFMTYFCVLSLSDVIKKYTWSN